MMQFYTPSESLSHTYLSTYFIAPTYVGETHYKSLEHTYIRLLLKFFVNKYIMLITHQNI